MKATPARPVLEEFEPRILYSADFAPAALAGYSLPGESEQRLLQAQETPAVASATLEIAFVDVSLPDAQRLIDDLQAQRDAGRPIDIVRIESGEDGIARISETLEGRSDIGAVHVLSHGSDGALQLGSVTLDAATLLARAGELAQWSSTLTHDADLLLYGCDVAQTGAGRQFVQGLAALTGADVAASTDITGATSARGNWALEFDTGRIEAAGAIGTAAQQAWAGTLVAPMNTVPGAQSTNEDTTKVFSSGNGNQISITDADAGTANNEVTLSVTNGSLTLSGIAGLSFTAGDGTADATMTLRGKASAINTALNGLAYIPTPGYSGGATLTVSTLDSTLLSLNIDANLAGRYTFDAGDARDDAPGTAQNGTLQGAAGVVADGARGPVLNLDGNRDYVQIAGRFGNPANVTLAAWVNFTTAPLNGGEVISLGDSALLRVDNLGNLQGYMFNGSTWKGVGYATTLAGTGWHHVAYSFDTSANVQKLYLDGVAVASVAESGSISYTLGANTTIGAHGNGSTTHDFAGKIDDARIYTRALTATEIGNLASDVSLRDTDSVAITVNAVNDAPVITNLAGDSLTYSSTGALIIEQGGNVTVSDVDSADFNTGTLRVSFTAGSDSTEDVLGIRNQGTGPGQIGVSGSNLTYNFGAGAVTIGSFAGGSGGADLVVTFNASATPAAAQALIRNVTFQDTDAGAPTTGARNVRFVLSDGDGASSGNHDTTVTVTGPNVAPVITSNGAGASAALNLAENKTAVTTVTATDADLPAQTLTYSISGGADAAKFSINPSTGMLSFVAAPDYEAPTDAGGNNVYDVTVRVSDGSLFATQALAVTVTDVGGPLIVTTTSDVLNGNVSSVEALIGNPGADGLISLREAISAANNTAGTDRINFAVNGTFSIAAFTSGDDSNTTGDFDVNGSVNIIGNGTVNTVINGNGNDRVFDLRSGTISLSGLTVQGGKSSLGAGISVGAAANVTLTDVVIQNNTGSGSSKGGGIYNDGALTLQNSIVQNNTAAFLSGLDGAGIYSDKDATLIANNVEIRNNAAGSADGGGLHVWESASVQLTNVTFANNQATRGGGLWNHSTSTSLVNVTFSGNSAWSEGGGLWADRSITLDHVTVAYNSATFWGGGAYDSNSNIIAKNSLFAGNTGGNTNRAPVSQGYNLSDDNSPGFLGTGDQKNVAAGLLALANNGGFTRTHAIAAGSAARDSANPVPASGTDQRGIAYSGGRADIGAYEYNLSGATPTVSAIANQTIDENTVLGPITFTIGDVESGAGSLIVTATSSNTALVPNANIVLGGSGANRTISLTPALNANSSANGGPTTITLSVSDGGNMTTTTFSVTVQNVNNAPTLTLPAAQTVDEATQLVLSGANSPSIGDVDAGTASLQVTVTATNGTLKLSQITGLSFVTGNSGFNATMTFNGSLADINAAFDGLRYKPEDGYSGAAQIDLSVNDLGNSGSGGAKITSGNIAITVAAVNDAPLLGVPGAQATPLLTPLTFSAASGNAITVSDIDAGGSNVQLTLSTSALANGTLSFGSTAGLTLVSGTGSNDVSVVLRGTLADLSAALETLSFSATGSGAARIDITLDDLGNTGAGGAKQASGAVTITVATDALPVLTLSQTTLTFTETDAATPLDPGLTVSDSDNPTLASALVRINGGYAGAEDVLAFTNVPATMGNIAGSYAGGVLSLSSAGQTATLAQWQAALRAISYVNTSDAPSTTPRTLTLTVNDGTADSATHSITLNVQAANDAPVLGGANDLVSIAEDPASNPGTLVATLIAGQISDADTAAQVGIAVTGANDANGVWQYTTDGGTNWSAFNDGFDTASDTSARLLTTDANSAVRFVPNANWNGTLAGALTFRAWDQTLGSAGGTADASSNGGSSAFSSASASSGITVTPVNDAPVLAGPIAAQAATQGVGFVFALPAGSFIDADTGDVLTYTATLASGAALPTWLSFDAGTQTFSGTPGNADVGAISVRVTARDGSDGVFGDFTLDVANVNDTPLLVSPIADQAATQDVAFVFGLPADSFTDADAGDVLTLTATLTGGGALPTWLSFDANTQTFSGTPGNADVGAISVRVTATDSSNATVFDDFTLTVANANDAPTVAAPIVDQNATQGAAFSFTVPGGSFADVDVGDTLSYTATLSGGGALPSWLSFNAVTQSFSGTPGNADLGAISLRVTATDASNASVFDDFTLSVANANDAPTVVAPIADQNATQDAAFSFTVPGGSFADIDIGDTLSYTATLSGGGALPTWLSFNAATRTFSGTPGNADVGAISVRVTATDASSASVFDDFTLSVANANDAPTVAAPIADQNATQGTPFSFTVPGGSLADIDIGDTLTNSATLVSGAALPAWLSFDANTQTFSGTPGNVDVGAINVRVTATDTSNATVFDDFTLTVANANDAPTVAAPIADQNATQGAAFSFAFGAGTFADIDFGDTLSYSATLSGGGALPTWLSFSATTRTFSGMPGNADVGPISVRVTATDTSNATVFDDFTLTVADANDAPTVAAPIADQNATQGAAFSFTVPGGSFADIDVGDTLSYGATLSGGGALPAWLSFNAATQTFTGTPTNADVGAINVRVTATDASNASVFDDFTLTVANVNDAPVITSNGGGAVASVNVAENNPTVTGVTATDPDALAVLRFAVTGGADATHFTIDPISGELRFVVAPDHELPADANRDNRYEVIVSVSDGALRAQQSLFIDVANVDEAPSIVTNALLMSNGSATLVLLGTDPDTGASALSYQASSQVGGRFELVVAPGVAVTGFNQAQVDAGAVRFVADGSGTSPTYVLSLSDGVSTVTSAAPNVVQQASPPIAALPVVPVVVTPDTPPAATTPAAAPAAAPPAAAPPAAVPATPGSLSPALLAEPRGDTFEPARAPSSGAAVAVPAASTATRDSTVTAVATLAQFALLSESSDNAATAGAPTIDLASALRDRLLGEQLDQQRDSAGSSQRSVKELQAASAVLTTSLSVGYVLWLARGGVLVASLMSALPAWAMVDPLPVLAQMKRRDGRADDGAPDDAADDPLEKLFSKARQVVARGAAPPLTASTPSDAKLAQGRSAADKNSLEQPA